MRASKRFLHNCIFLRLSIELIIYWWVVANRHISSESEQRWKGGMETSGAVGTLKINTLVFPWFYLTFRGLAGVMLFTFKDKWGKQIRLAYLGFSLLQHTSLSGGQLRGDPLGRKLVHHQNLISSYDTSFLILSERLGRSLKKERKHKIHLDKPRHPIDVIKKACLPFVFDRFLIEWNIFEGLFGKSAIEHIMKKTSNHLLSINKLLIDDPG